MAGSIRPSPVGPVAPSAAGTGTEWLTARNLRVDVDAELLSA